MEKTQEKFVIFNPKNSLFWNNDSGWGDLFTADRTSAADKELSTLPMEGEWMTEEVAHALNRAADLYNDLTDAADGGGAISVDEEQASIILAMFRDAEYLRKVREVWDTKYA